VAIGDLELAHTTIATMSSRAEEASAAALGVKTLMVCLPLEAVTTHDAAQTSTSETPVVTSVMKELLTQHVPTLMGATMMPPFDF